MTAVVVLLVLLSLALLVILGLFAQRRDVEMRNGWLARELKETQESNAELRERLKPFEAWRAPR